MCFMGFIEQVVSKFLNKCYLVFQSRRGGGIRVWITLKRLFMALACYLGTFIIP